jgi:hypothetical protein
MRKYAAAALTILTALSLSGCGSGGGGSSSPPTKAVAAVYLFGNMSTNSKVAAIQSTFVVPTGILVNYSSPAPPGYLANTYPLRSGTIVPSGPVALTAAEITGSYNTASGKITISMVNQNGLDMRSSSIGPGTEIASIIYNLPAPGVIPVLPEPWEDPLVTVYQHRATLPVASVVMYPGFKLNFKVGYL